MSRILKRTASVIALDRDGIAASQTPAGAGNLTLTAGAASLSPPRRVTIYSGADLTARTFTVYGTDRGGSEMTETIAGPNNTTVSGSKIFKTVTRIAVDAGTGAAVEAGWDGTSLTSWMHIGGMRGRIVVDVPNGATVDYRVEATAENLLRAPGNAAGYEPASTAIVATSTSATGGVELDTPWSAIRLIIEASLSVPLTMRFIPHIGGR